MKLWPAPFSWTTRVRVETPRRRVLQCEPKYKNVYRVWVVYFGHTYFVDWNRTDRGHISARILCRSVCRSRDIHGERSRIFSKPSNECTSARQDRQRSPAHGITSRPTNPVLHSNKPCAQSPRSIPAIVLRCFLHLETHGFRILFSRGWGGTHGRVLSSHTMLSNTLYVSHGTAQGGKTNCLCKSAALCRTIPEPPST